jgi:hypothetical protein
MCRSLKNLPYMQSGLTRHSKHEHESMVLVNGGRTTLVLVVVSGCYLHIGIYRKVRSTHMVLAVMAKFFLTFLLRLFIQVLFTGRTLTSCTCIKLTWATYVTAKDKSVPRVHYSSFLVLVGSIYNSVHCSEFV